MYLVRAAVYPCKLSGRDKLCFCLFVSQGFTSYLNYFGKKEPRLKLVEGITIFVFAEHDKSSSKCENNNQAVSTSRKQQVKNVLQGK